MLTIFSMPKAFEGHIGVIQRNAIRSWTRLPGCRILLIGDDAGTAEMAAEVGAQHVRDTVRSAWGTPLVDAVFAAAERASGPDDLLCYVNADIILMSDFAEAIQTLLRWRRDFLMVGRRMEMDLTEPIVFDDGWEPRLREAAATRGRLRGPEAIDYFVFRRGTWPKIPPFAIGRFTWDNWLLYDAVSRGVAMVDATPRVLAVHQNHDYGNRGRTEADARRDEEVDANRALFPDGRRHFGIFHARHLLCDHGVRRARTREHLSQRAVTWLLFHPTLLTPIRLIKRWRSGYSAATPPPTREPAQR